MGKVLIGQGAEDDYAESLRWYAERSKPAADGFEAEFARALEAIAANPDRYPLCDDRHRFYLLKRYPFQVIYRKTADEDLLIVVAVAHTSRRPDYWSKR
jgi:plasmid stabilization system protein ParE